MIIRMMTCMIIVQDIELIRKDMADVVNQIQHQNYVFLMKVKLAVYLDKFKNRMFLPFLFQIYLLTMIHLITI